MEGKVKFFNETKGFGFIKEPNADGSYSDDSKTPEHFVHISNVNGDMLAQNQIVSFDIREGRNGKMEAYNVSVIG